MRDSLDSAIVVGYLLLTLCLGVFVGRRQKHSSLRQYALADREVPWWAVLGSIIAAETSAATFLGAPAESYKNENFVYCQLALGMIIARIIVAQLFIKIYYDHNVVSIYEFLKFRFGPATRNAASLIFIIGRLLGIGVRLYLGGVVFVAVWRQYFKTEPDLLQYGTGIIILLFVTAFYTTLGGIKAVVYTDVVQALTMLTDFGLLMPASWPTIAWLWYAPIGCGTTLIAALPFRKAKATATGTI